MIKLLYIFMIIPVLAFADSNKPVDVSWSCWAAASEKHGVSIDILRAIAKQESNFNHKAIGKNTNGTEDIGLMQINSSWLKPSSKLGMIGVQKEDLMDPCFNLHVGAWLLKRNFNDFGYNWRAIGAYNARSEHKRALYAGKINKQLKRMQKSAN